MQRFLKFSIPASLGLGVGAYSFTNYYQTFHKVSLANEAPKKVAEPAKIEQKPIVKEKEVKVEIEPQIKTHKEVIKSLVLGGFKGVLTWQLIGLATAPLILFIFPKPIFPPMAMKVLSLAYSASLLGLLAHDVLVTYMHINKNGFGHGEESNKKIYDDSDFYSKLGYLLTAGGLGLSFTSHIGMLAGLFGYSSTLDQAKPEAWKAGLISGLGATMLYTMTWGLLLSQFTEFLIASSITTFLFYGIYGYKLWEMVDDYTKNEFDQRAFNSTMLSVHKWSFPINWTLLYVLIVTTMPI